MQSLQHPLLGDECVVLRGWRSDDAEALRPACGDRAICRFTTVPLSYSLEAAQAWIARQHARAHDGTALVWALIPQKHDLPVGMVGLFGLAETEPAARFGYWLVSDWRGRGLVSAATALVARWAFPALGLSAMHIDRERGDQASARVAERLGAVISGSRQVTHDGGQLELVRHTLTRPML